MLDPQGFNLDRTFTSYHHTSHHPHVPTNPPTYLPTYPPTHLPTYLQIIPLDSSLGLIEWLPETKVLKDVMFEGLKHHYQFSSSGSSSSAAGAGAGAAAAEGRGHRAQATEPEVDR